LGAKNAAADLLRLVLKAVNGIAVYNSGKRLA
jgi:hypothetical protein